MAKLKSLQIDRPMQPGRYGDGDGLYLLVGPNGAKSWIFRYRVGGRERQMGLGSVDVLSLAGARIAAGECRKLRSQDKDPIAMREAARALAMVEQAQSQPFKDAAEEYIAANEAGWKNKKHRQQWRNTMSGYVYPLIGKIPVAEVDRALVLQVMTQRVGAELSNKGRIIRPAGTFWQTRPHTALRIRGRIELILDWAKAHGRRKGDNPASWRGNLRHAWPNRGATRKVRHHAALPYTAIPEFMKALRKQKGVAPLALEFCILNAPRTTEVLHSLLPEIDHATPLWTIPEERMKAGEEHRVPLTAAALDVLDRASKLRTDGDFIFPGWKRGKPLSNMAMLVLVKKMGFKDAKGRPITVHGFRSTFRDWTAECTNFPREVAEMALAHTVGDEVENAYRRGELLEKRRALMNAWADFCAGKSNVVSLTSAAA